MKLRKAITTLMGNDGSPLLLMRKGSLDAYYWWKDNLFKCVSKKKQEAEIAVFNFEQIIAEDWEVVLEDK